MALESATSSKPTKATKGSKKGRGADSASGGCGLQDFPLFCEGWMEKYSLGRSLFSSKGWHKRYFFLSSEGLGYAHKNPREAKEKNGARVPPHTLTAAEPADTAERQKANLRYNLYPYKRPLKVAFAKCFIPFDKKHTVTADSASYRRAGFREATLLPVYFLENTDVVQHPEVGATCHNGISCERVSVESPSSSEGGGGAVSQEPEGRFYYYLAISFEEKRKRFLLLLRTRNVQVYLKFKFYLRLFVHEGSRYSLVPVFHPLEVNRPVPNDVNRKRILASKSGQHPHTSSMAPGTTAGFALGGSAMQLSYYRDPDPCTHDELHKIKKASYEWDAGERDRMLSPVGEFATLRRQLALSLGECESEVQATHRMSSELYVRQSVLDVMDTVGPSMPDAEYEQDITDEPAAMEQSASGALYGGDSSPHTVSPQKQRSALNVSGSLMANTYMGPVNDGSNGLTVGGGGGGDFRIHTYPTPSLGLASRGASPRLMSQLVPVTRPRQHTVFSDASYEDEAGNSLILAGDDLPARRRFYHHNNPQNHRTQNVVVADRIEPLQKRNHMIGNECIRRSPGNDLNDVDEGSGIVTAR